MERPVVEYFDVGDVSFPEALRRFEDFLVLRGRSEKTRHTYGYQLTLFWCRHLCLRELDLLSATALDVEEYLGTIARQGRSFGDAARALKAFYRWAQGRLRPDNPATDVVIPRPKLAPAPDLPTGELRALLRAAFRREHRRGWAILLCFKTGARIGSFTAVLPEHIELDGEEPSIWFEVAKSGRPYSVPLDRAARIAARNLLELGLPTLIGVGPAQFRNWLTQAELEAGTRHVWPHLLRHAFSNRVARRGDVEAWRRAMNHRDLSQWPRYVRADSERLRAAVSDIL